jgi:hypothetical protein
MDIGQCKPLPLQTHTNKQTFLDLLDMTDNIDCSINSAKNKSIATLDIISELGHIEVTAELCGNLHYGLWCLNGGGNPQLY